VILDLLSYSAFFMVTALSFAIICLGLNVQWGQTGLFNVGVAGFVALGAYVSALLTTPLTPGRLGGYGLPIALGWVAAMVLAGLASAFIGAVTMRLRTDYLAITTFGVATVIHLVILNAQSLTGGPFGIAFIPRLFAVYADRPRLMSGAQLAIVAGLTGLVFAAMQGLARSPWGRVLRAIREDEEAAASLGKSGRRFRLQAFALGGALMGLAGAVHAHVIGFISPDDYLPSLTFQVWTMLIIGGAGNNWGALVGAVVVWGIWSMSGLALSLLFPPGQQARAASLQIVSIGLLLVAILLLRPRGILGEAKTISRHIADAERDAARRYP
jgi:branched-chain amino acid transport system permease protein